jgi:SAM-dependent methyltransferase
MNAFLIARPIHEDLCFDELRIHDCGLVQIIGWQRHRSTTPLSLLSIRVNLLSRPLLQHYRYRRDDVPDSLPSGICLEFDLGAEIVRAVEVMWGNDSLFSVEGLEIRCQEPHYGHLRFTEHVLGRDGIYGFGPPNPNVHPEVEAMALRLRPPVLDFGCGIGALIRVLRRAGIESYGIELERPGILENLPEDMRPFVTLYGGTFPIPFPDKSFASVVCSEVLEHIRDYENAVQQIARVCRGQLFLTVPDVSVIALLHKHNVVPWHLLESTHVNFFNQTSLDKLLKRYFHSVLLFRLGSCCINGTPYRESLVALCSIE